MKELPHTRSCFVCGESNRAGLNLRFETDGKIVQARFVPQVEHVGFKETVHGGLIATVLDEIMVWACAVGTKKFAFCAELTVRFLHPLKPGHETILYGELLQDRRKLFEAKAELRDAGGTVYASGTGKYLPIKEAEAKEMESDFVAGAKWGDI
jgi:acyl-coenzyme A thioesterase PaaI-like protein